MTEFIFRFPAGTPEMTFETLAGRLEELCDQEGCTSCYDQIGSTVQVRWHTRDRSAVMVRLYSTTIAVLADDGTIRFPNDDPHLATTAWIERIVSDNDLGHRAGRIRRRAGDGQGPETPRGRAGLLVIDFDREKPLIGCTYRIRDKAVIARIGTPVPVVIPKR